MHSFYESTTEREKNNRPSRTGLQIHMKALGKLLKGMQIIKKAKSAKKRFGCFVCCPTLRSNYLLTGISTQ